MDENNVLEMSTEDQAVAVETMELLLEEADKIITKLDRTILDLTKKVNVSFTTGVICGGAIGVVSVVGGYFTAKKIQEYLDKKKFEKMSEEI